MLGDARKKLNLSLLTMYPEKTKIRRHIIEAFENGEFDVLASYLCQIIS
jgi:cytoskeletal protein RodZ